MGTKTKKRAIHNELAVALQAALRYERGEREPLRVTELPPPPKKLGRKQVKEIRKALGVSQVIFARVINVSPNAVRSWEQGTRRPTAAALKLLTVAKEHPESLLKRRA